MSRKAPEIGTKSAEAISFGGFVFLTNSKQLRTADGRAIDLRSQSAEVLSVLAARPGDVKVASQAKASLAIALAANWRINDGAAEGELAAAMAAIDPKFARTGAVRAEVRGKLAKIFVGANKLVDAEFLQPGSVDPIDLTTGKPIAKTKPNWNQISFLNEMIARFLGLPALDRQHLRHTHGGVGREE